MKQHIKAEENQNAPSAYQLNAEKYNGKIFSKKKTCQLA